MRCDHCGFVLPDGADRCPNCGKPVSPVSVLSPQERESFDGVTIEQDGRRTDENGRRNQQRIYFRHIKMGGGGNNKFSGLITLLIIGLVIAIFLFFAVPLILFLVVGAIVMWILNRLF